MKRIILAAVMLSIGSGGTAEDSSADNSRIWDSACNQIGEIAESIMRARQNNMPISRLIARNNETIGSKSDTASVEYAAILRGLILVAYEASPYSTPKFQDDEVADFRNDAEYTCFQGRLSEYADQD